MTKAYLAGFIAGTMGKTWDDCPFMDEYSYPAAEWRRGQLSGFEIFKGCHYTGSEEIK